MPDATAAERQTSLATADTVEALRRQRRTQDHIATELGISKAIVSENFLVQLVSSANFFAIGSRRRCPLPAQSRQTAWPDTKAFREHLDARIIERPIADQPDRPPHCRS